MSSIRDQSSAVPSTTNSIELDDISSSPSLDNYGREDGSSDEVSDTPSMSTWTFIQENSHAPYLVDPNAIIYPMMQYGYFNPIPYTSTYWNPILPFVFHPSQSPLLTWQWQNGNFINNMWYHLVNPSFGSSIHQSSRNGTFSTSVLPSLERSKPISRTPRVFPSPYHVTYGQHGYSIAGESSYFSSPSTYVSDDHLRRLEGHYYTSQFMEVEAGRNHWPIFESVPPHIVDPHIGHQVHLVPAQATLMPPMYHVHPIAFESPTAMFSQDMHHGMRLDIDNMSYEELLALEEQIGDVSTALREETIMELLKRRYHIRIGTFTNSDEPCSICREEYVHGDEIGALNCGHEFHIGCIKQWLIVKNTCLICKMKGLDA